jgi:dienelactone hydrolase
MRPLPLSISFLSLAGLLLVSPANAQQKPGDVMFDSYLAAETDKLTPRFLNGATTLAEWEKQRPGLREQYLDMLGLWPLPEKTPLKATITGTLEHAGVVIEKLHYQSRPGLYVTANLYRPKEVKGKLPAILYVCGHSGRGRDGNKTAFQEHGLWFASNGYVCLALDTLQLGEIPGVHHGTYGRPFLHLKAYGIKDKDVFENRWWWQAAGYTPAGVECWNGIRGIDYLISRPEVDPGRIGVTGISGGGAATFWIAAADERVRCAVPVSGMSDLPSYVKDKVINGHCDCMFLINSYGWEWTTIAALVAPRPLLFANSDKDKIFPMDGNRRIIERLRGLYKMYGKPDLVDEYVSMGGHDYRPDLRVAVFRFINKHLKNDAGPVKDADFPPIKGKELRAFAEDRDLPADVINIKIDETFVSRAPVTTPGKEGHAAWRGEVLKRLRYHSFHAFPKEIPPAQPGSKFLPMRKGVQVLTTEPGIEVALTLLQPAPGGSRGGTLIVLNPGEEANEIPAWAKAYASNGPVYLLEPRGVGPTAWTKKSPPNYVERAHALIGRTVDQGRLWDVVATLRWLHAQDGEPKEAGWKVIGKGQAGVLAAYARLFEAPIAELVLVEPPASHKEGPIFLNVLRILDVPEALGMAAPTPLTLVNAPDAVFQRVAQVYESAGAKGKVKRK